MAEEESAKKRPQFGSRYLTDEKNVFQHNAWDNVQWGEEQEREALSKVQKHTECLMPADAQELLSKNAAEKWEDFYGIHQNRFFKDRHWLFTEFPELNKSCICADEDKGKIPRENINESYPGSHANMAVLEVGCGVGNTVFPILESNNDKGLFVYCCDFSRTAVNLVQEHESYDIARCHAFECDISDMEYTMPFPDNSIDIITMIFVLSAIKPERVQVTLNRLARLLKPGGRILFRDYGRYDLAQLRFKQGRCLQDNFYARGDGTLVYFFTQDEMKEKMAAAGLVEESNLVDRRLQVNRGRQLKMYRVWIQCKYRKPNTDDI